MLQGGRKEAELQGRVGCLALHFTSFLCPCPCCRPWFEGSSFPKQIEAALPRVLGGTQRNSQAWARPHVHCPATLQVPVCSLQLPTQFSYFLSPDSGHPCLGGHGRQFCHQLVLTGAQRCAAPSQTSQWPSACTLSRRCRGLGSSACPKSHGTDVLEHPDPLASLSPWLCGPT